MKNKIMIIYTGGTIGSDRQGDSVNLNSGSRKLLLDMYRQSYGDKISFDCLSPVNILSENVQVSDLRKIYDCLKSVPLADYDGVIITHGTDTLCFTVNLFGRLFSGIKKPVVFVSALYPLSDPRSNGLKNFAGAVDFIQKGGVGGVYCSFANDGEDCKIHLATRLVYPDEVNGFYHSALGDAFADIKNGNVVFNNSRHLPTREEINAAPDLVLPFAIDDKITVITMRALLNFALYDFSRIKPKAVIVELSHSGTVCTVGEEINFKKFAAYCEQTGVELIISLVNSTAGVYASMQNLPDNVLTAYDKTLEMTIVDVMCALGEGKPAHAYLNDDAGFENLRLK